MRDISMIDQLKFRYALGPARHAAIKHFGGSLGIILMLLLAYGIVGRIDYEDALRIEAEAAQGNAVKQQDALLSCLNGGDSGLYTVDADGVRHHIVCERAYEVNDLHIRGNQS